MPSRSNSTRIDGQADHPEEQLLQLLVDLPSEVVRAVCDLGVETCIDFRGLWCSAEDCVSEVEHLLGAELEPGVAFQLARSWTMARREVEDQVHAAVAAVVQYRNSSLGTRSRSPPRAAVQPPPASNRVRPLVVGGGGVLGPLVVRNPSHVAPFTAEDEARQMKLEILFRLAVDHILDLDELGVTRSELKDPLRWREFRDTTLSAASRLSLQRLGMLVSSFKRWLKFCDEAEVDCRQPSPLQLASFLKKITIGGPTASSSMHAALTWFVSSLGANIPVSHWMVRPYKFHAASHSGRQAPELEPWELGNLLLILKETKGTHQVIIAMVIMAAVGCIRWEHIQRSKLTTDQAAWAEMWCSQGKSRKQGARPAYSWALPEVVFRGCSLLKILCGFWRHEASIDATFLVPGLKLEAHDLWEVTESTAFWGTRPMSRGRYLELFRGALIKCGVDHAQAQRATFNRLRRCLPTMANALRLDVPDMQAIGNWVEIPEGGCGDGTKKPKGTMPMGVHYAGGRTGRSATVKLRCVTRFIQLLMMRLSKVSLNVEGLMPPDSWRWHDFMEDHACIPETVPPIQGEAEEAPLPLVIEDEDKPQPSSQRSGSVSISSDEESVDLSPSASDNSTDGHDLVGVWADPSMAEHMDWMVQGKKVHVIREEPEGERPVPWCRERSFAQDPQKRGSGFTSASQAEFCQRCLGRLPRSMYSALADHCGWMN